MAVTTEITVNTCSARNTLVHNIINHRPLMERSILSFVSAMASI